MEMLSSFGCDKHEFCLVDDKFKYVRSCPSFDITFLSSQFFFYCISLSILASDEMM